jgi:hypothetical protein
MNSMVDQTAPTEPQGSFLGLPYDFRKPTVTRVKERFWNPDDSRVLTPMVFGWGYAINLYEVGRRLSPE